MFPTYTQTLRGRGVSTSLEVVITIRFPTTWSVNPGAGVGVILVVGDGRRIVGSVIHTHLYFTGGYSCGPPLSKVTVMFRPQWWSGHGSVITGREPDEYSASHQGQTDQQLTQGQRKDSGQAQSQDRGDTKGSEEKCSHGQSVLPGRYLRRLRVRIWWTSFAAPPASKLCLTAIFLI